MRRHAISGKRLGKTKQTVHHVGYKNDINKRGKLNMSQSTVKKLPSMYCRSAEGGDDQIGSAVHVRVVGGKSTFMCLRPHIKYTPAFGLSKRKLHVHVATDGQSVLKSGNNRLSHTDDINPGELNVSFKEQSPENVHVQCVGMRITLDEQQECLPRHKRKKGSSHGVHLKHRQTTNIVTRSKSLERLRPCYRRMLLSGKNISSIARGFGRAPMMLRPNTKYMSVFPKRHSCKRRNRKQRRTADKRSQTAQCNSSSSEVEVQGALKIQDIQSGKWKETGLNALSVEEQCRTNKSKTSEQSNTSTCAIEVKCNERYSPPEIEQFSQVTANGNSAAYLKAQKNPSPKCHHSQTKKGSNGTQEAGSDASDSTNEFKCQREWSVLQEINDVSSHQLVPRVQDNTASAACSDKISRTRCQTRSKTASKTASRFAPKKLMVLRPYTRYRSVACKTQLKTNNCKHWLLIQAGSHSGQHIGSPEEMLATENLDRNQKHFVQQVNSDVHDTASTPTDSWQTSTQAVCDYAPKTLMMLRPYTRYTCRSTSGKSLLSRYDTGHWLLAQIRKSDTGYLEVDLEAEEAIPDPPVKEDKATDVNEPLITTSSHIDQNIPHQDDDAARRAEQANTFMTPDETLSQLQLRKEANSTIPNVGRTSQKEVHKGFEKSTEKLSKPQIKKVAKSNNLKEGENPQRTIPAKGPDVQLRKIAMLTNLPAKVQLESENLMKPTKNLAEHQVRNAAKSTDKHAGDTLQNAVLAEGLQKATEKTSDCLAQIVSSLQTGSHKIKKKTSNCKDQEIVSRGKSDQQKQSGINSDPSVPFVKDNLPSQTNSHELFRNSCHTRTQAVSDYAPKNLMMLRAYTNYRSIAGKLESSKNETGHLLLAQMKANGTGWEKIAHTSKVEKVPRFLEQPLNKYEPNKNQDTGVKTRSSKAYMHSHLPTKCHMCVAEPLQKSTPAKRLRKPTEKLLGFWLRKKSRCHHGVQPPHAHKVLRTGVRKPTEVLSRPRLKKVAKSSSIHIREGPQKAALAKRFTKPTQLLSGPRPNNIAESGHPHSRASAQKAVKAERFKKSAGESPELQLEDVVKPLDAHAEDPPAAESPQPHLEMVTQPSDESAISLQPMKRQRRRCLSVYAREASNCQLAKIPHKRPDKTGDSSQVNLEDCPSSSQLHFPSSNDSSNCFISHKVSGDKQATLTKQNRLHKVCLDIHVRGLSVLLHEVQTESIEAKLPSDMSELAATKENTAVEKRLTFSDSAAVMDSKFKTTDVTEPDVTNKSLDDRHSAISVPHQSSLGNQRNCKHGKEECIVTKDSASFHSTLEKEKNVETELEEQNKTNYKLSSHTCTCTSSENGKSVLEECKYLDERPACQTSPEKDKNSKPAPERYKITTCTRSPIKTRQRTSTCMKLRKKDKHFLFSQLGFKKSKRRPFHGIRNDKHGRKQNLVTVRTLPKERRTSTVKESKQTDFQHPRGTGVREMVQPNEDTLLPQRRGRARKRKKIVDDSTPANFILLHKRNREGLPLTQQTSSQPELWHSHSKNTSYTHLQRLQKSKEIPNGCLSRPNQARKQSLKSSRVEKQDSCKRPKTRCKSSAAYAGMTLANLEHLPLSKRIRQLIPGYTSPDEEEFTLEEFCNIETLEEAVEMAARETRSGDEQEPHHQNASTVKKEKSTDSESLLIPSSSGKKRRSKRSSRSPEGSYWDCSVCTYRNKAEAFKCAMCDVRKGTSTRKPRLNAQLVAQQQAQQNLSPLIHVKPVKTTPRGPTPRKAGTTKKPRPRLKNVDRSSAISTEVIVNNVPVIITEFKEKSHTRTTVDSDEASADRTNGNVNGL